MIDDVVAFDRGDGDGRPGLGHGDGLAGGGLVAIGVGDQCSDGGGAVGPDWWRRWPGWSPSNRSVPC